MDDYDKSHMRMRALELAHGILNGSMLTLSSQADWNAVAPTTDQVVTEAEKLMKFIEG